MTPMGVALKPMTTEKWVKGASAVGYSFSEFALPEWRLTFCDLRYGH
jgi:hypothetical protein